MIRIFIDRGFRFFYDYSISPQGIRFYVFRKIPVGFVPRARITSVEVVLWLDILKSPKSFFLLQGRTAHMGNTIQREVLIVHTNYLLLKTIALTPKDPARAASDLNDPPKD
jgi:hypothetical protein